MMLPPIARQNVARHLSFNTRAHSFSSALKLSYNFLSRRNYATIDTMSRPGEEIRGSNNKKYGDKGRIRKQLGVTMYPIPSLDYTPSKMLEARTDGKILELPSRKRADGGENVYVAMSARWLRDNCACTQCRNQDTGQRQINVLKGMIDCTIKSVSVADSSDNIIITFGDGHQTEYTQSQLVSRKSPQTSYKRRGVVPITTWTAAIASNPPTVQFSTIDTEGLGPLLQRIREFGFCFVDGMPATPEASEALLSAIGPIRNTHYGGFYDFTADLSSKDTAYTSESLEPHTDNTYFTEPTGLQALHLLSHTEGSGGESSLVDGFAAAAMLFEEDPQAYKKLSLTGVHAHASGNEGISIQPAHAVPTLSHDLRRGNLTQVRWNNADRAGVECGIAEMDRWYDAAAKFDALLSDPKNQYWFQLTPGKMLIFDNWRVLHGRAAFTGKRRMCGGYINRDDFISKYRMTNMSEADIRASTVTG